jgi:hypothetical protein
MITADEARHIAADAEHLADIDLADWPRGRWGEAIPVSDTARRPSYWLVPYWVDDRAVGFARIHAEGRLLAIGSLGQPGRALEHYPKTVTGVPATRAWEIFEDCVRLEAGETAAKPIYVHDGPPGREAWLVETTRGGRPHRWVFVTAAGCYERSAGTALADDLEG